MLTPGRGTCNLSPCISVVYILLFAAVLTPKYVPEYACAKSIISIILTALIPLIAKYTVAPGRSVSGRGLNHKCAVNEGRPV